MEGLIQRQEKPSNTEVLGLLMDEDKLKFITNLNRENIKGLCKLMYLTQRFQDEKKDAIEIHNQTLIEYLNLLCSDKGKRSEQVVDALKHIIEDQNQDDMKSMLEQIRK